MPRGNQRWRNPTTELSSRQTEEEEQFKCLPKNEVFNRCSHIIFGVNWDESQVARGGIFLQWEIGWLPFCLTVYYESFILRRERGGVIYVLKAWREKHITFDKAELNFNPNSTSESSWNLWKNLSRQFKIKIHHWEVGRIMLSWAK